MSDTTTTTNSGSNGANSGSAAQGSNQGTAATPGSSSNESQGYSSAGGIRQADPFAPLPAARQAEYVPTITRDAGNTKQADPFAPISDVAPPKPEAGQTQSDGSVVIQIQQAPDDNKKLFAQFVPDEHKSKEWYKNLEKTENPRSEFVKMLENAQSMIGRQQTALNVPTEESTPEQVKAFHRQIGVPETSESYTWEGLKVADGHADKPFVDLVNTSRPPEIVKELAKFAHEEGLTAKQFQRLAEKQDQLTVDLVKRQSQQIQANAAETEKAHIRKAHEIVGSRRDQVAKNSDRLMSELPHNVQALAQNLSSDQRIVLAVMMDTVYQKYVQEDGVNTSQAFAQIESPQVLRQQRIELMKRQEGMNPTHPDYNYLKESIDNINLRMKQYTRR